MERLYYIKIKSLLKDKPRMIGTFFLPLLLLIIGGILWPNVSEKSEIQTIHIAVVLEKEEPLDVDLITAMEKKFNVKKTSIAQAEALLYNNEISGYVVLSSSMRLVVKEAGIEETFIKHFLDTYKQKLNALESISEMNAFISQQDLKYEMLQGRDYVFDISSEREGNRPREVYFYTVFVMASLLASLWGVREITNIQPFLSQKGIQMQISAVGKMKVFTCNLVAVLTLQLVLLSILLSYISIVLKGGIGLEHSKLLLICISYSLIGVSIGTMLGAIIKYNESVKESILKILSVSISVLAGIYYYKSGGKLLLNPLYVTMVAVLFLFVTYWTIRGKKYASI
jgi:ABC-2 type transport system permease protein